MKKCWQEELRNNITTAEELVNLGIIPPEKKEEIAKIIEKYPMSIPRYYLGLIKTFDGNDPIYRMAVAGVNELSESGRLDTSGEAKNTVTEGVQHKYSNTALILSTNICAMYCRHCFRKRMVGLTEEEVLSVTDEAIKYIDEHPEIDNVLISGGDSFMNGNNIIERYLSALSKNDNIKFIIFGTRTPVVFPQRITDDPELLEILKKYSAKKSIFIVTQFNHPNELTPESGEALRLIRETGVPVLNQTVLMKGVNGDADTLVSLFNGLLENGVNPYYLFQCRPVKGIKDYYALPLIDSVALVDEVRSRLSGVAKSFRFIMSHISGKIEIIGKSDNKMIMKRHQAKESEDINKIFMVEVRDDSKWLPDDFVLEEI